MSEYINRHGKKIRVNDDEVLAIDTSTPVIPDADKVKRRILPRLRVLNLPRPHLSRRTVIFGGIVILGVAVAVLVTADSVKRDYERQAAAMRRTVTDRSKQSLSAETSAANAIKSLRGALLASTSCKVSGIDVVSWYGPAKVAREDCQKTADNYRKLQLALDDMSVMTAYLETMSSALSPSVTIPAEQGFAVISEYAQNWNASIGSLEQIKPPPALNRQHQTLLAKASTLREAWDALVSANNARTIEGFKAAEAKLTESYTDFRTAADGIVVIIQSTQSSINRYVTSLVE